MSKELPPLEHQILELREQVKHLAQRVNQLEQTKPFAAETPSLETKPETLSTQPVHHTSDIASAGESIMLLSSSSVLQYISTLSFLLVAALGLRALADNGIIGLQLGSILGICYATALIVSSHLLYRKKKILAPLFATTGALLMFSILIESHARFASIPTVAVYALLAITGISLALISYANKAALPIIIGTLGMCLSAAAVDYPTPLFPLLSILLWIANILGYFATRLKRCSWLRWILMFTTHFMLQIWGLKLSSTIIFKKDSTVSLNPEWFIPIVTLFGFTFIMISLFGIIRSGEDKISKFDFSLPALNAAWCYIAGIYALKDPVAFGAPAAAAAIVHFGLAYWLSTRQKRNAPGTNTFVAGGVILTALSLPAMLGSFLAPLPILAGLALTISYYSRIWQSGGMRLTAILIQIYTATLLSMEFMTNGMPEKHAVVILAAALCCLFGILQYNYLRRHKPPRYSAYFSRIDKQDTSTIFSLFAFLINGYLVGICLIHAFLQQVYSGDLSNAFIACQSLLINSSAIALIMIAAKRHNKELRNTSILITFFAGCKVFLVDMLQISGSWLVASIFAFGIAAALESFVLARWKTEQPQSEAEPPTTHLEENQEQITV